MEARLIRVLAEEIFNCAKLNGDTIVTAESCSAGLLALSFSKVEGASQYFMGGFVTYTKDMKMRALGVPAELLEDKTAVCGEVAEAMAMGALSRSGATLAVSVTGVAGPSEDEDGNPVGLVYCGVARKGVGSKHIQLQCRPGRPEAILDEACNQALRFLRPLRSVNCPNNSPKSEAGGKSKFLRAIPAPLLKSGSCNRGYPI
jgi:nicotinamide-nucleotide amidase